jgi:hypothetical protein
MDGVMAPTPGAPPPAEDDARTPGARLIERAADRARVWKLGTHDGLTRVWKPVARNGTK